MEAGFTSSPFCPAVKTFMFSLAKKFGFCRIFSRVSSVAMLWGTFQIRVHLDVGHLPAEDGRFLEGRAHDDLHRQDGRLILDDLEAVARNVYHDVGVPQVLGKPAPSLQVELDLANALFHGYVEGPKRPGANDSVIEQTMAQLELLYRLFDGLVEEIARCRPPPPAFRL